MRFRMLAAACSLLLPGCTSGMISAQAVGPAMLTVCDRHDEYVLADTTKDAFDKDNALRTTALIRAILLEAGYPAEVPEAKESTVVSQLGDFAPDSGATKRANWRGFLPPRDWYGGRQGVGFRK